MFGIRSAIPEILGHCQRAVKDCGAWVVDHFAKTSTTKGTKVHEGKAGEQRTSWHFVSFMI
jgi:hypothetical protein